MGHYESPKDTPSGNIAEHANVYGNFKSHCAGDRTETELAITVAIRESHAESQVTIMDARSCDVIGFAAAGHVDLRLRREGDNFLERRTYAPPATRLEGGQGTLSTRVSFGYYDATFKGQKFNLYEARWRDEFFGRPEARLFILSPKSSPTAVSQTGQAEWVDAFLLAMGKWTSELHEEIYVFDGGDWDKNKALWKAVQKSSWDDVIIDPQMKETLISDIHNFFDSQSTYEEYSVAWKRGIILHGTPGCGKTISIKALINELDKRDKPVASLYVKTFTTNCPGEEYSIREIFQKARVMAPCMLVFEDLDSLVKDKIRSYFLNEVDGLEDNNGILMVGSTNHLERLDPGIAKRPSRFDRKYHFRMPAFKERVLYCDYWKKKLEKNSKIDFDPEISQVVAKLTEGFSFAYLKELFVQSLLTIVGAREHELNDARTEEVEKNAKVVDGSASLAKGSETVDGNQDTEMAEDHTSEKPQNAHGMPEVEIPASLESNSLMRILQKQCIALWKDMDNSKDEEAGKKPDGKEDDDDEAGEDEGSADYRQQVSMTMMRRRHAAALRRRANAS